MCNSFNKKFLDEANKIMNDGNDNLENVHEHFMDEAIKIAINGVNNNEGGPFGCVVVLDGKIIGKGNNRVTTKNDPTAHAEMEAIRAACKTLKSFQLEACTIYTSCEPCPMCLGAIYWARPAKVYYGCNKKDAAELGFDDNFIYKEMNLPNKNKSISLEQISKEDALKPFQIWKEKEDKIEY